MKKLKKPFLRCLNQVIVLLLTFLGFTVSCDSINNGADEYGSPSATFKILGRVESNITGKPVPNIQVSINSYDTVYTNQNGDYISSINSFPDDKNFHISFNDIDGELNGDHAKLDTMLGFENPEFTGGDGSWYAGETSKTFNVKLSKKNNED